MDSHSQNKSGFPDQTVVTSPPRFPSQPPQYSGPQQAQPAPQVVGANVYHAGGAVIVTQQMGRNPTRTVCKSCNQEITTTTKPKSSMRTHLVATIFCVTLLWPCVCIPYCVDSCRNTEHYCPNCDSYIGVHVN